MTSLSFLFLFLQYIVGALLIIGLSLLAIAKFKVNPVAVSLLVFGACIAAWDILVFLHRIAETAETSLTILKLSSIISPFIFGFYFLLFLNIWQTRKLNLLCLIPSFVGGAFSTENINEVTPGAYGWSYRMQPISQGTAVTLYGATIAYMLIIIMVLVYLSLRSPSKNLRKRFLYILTVFILFQVIGLILTNVLFIQINPDFPPLGGILHLATFAAISYTVFYPIRKDTTIIPEVYEAKTALEGFLRSLYTSFIQDDKDVLGSRHFQFVAYLRACGLEEILDLSGSGLLVAAQKKEGLNSSQLACIVDKAFFLLERNEVSPELVGKLIEFLNVTYQQIGAELVAVFKKHEDYVKNSGILYKVAGGRFRLLLAPEGFSEEDLEKFSSSIGFVHEKLERTQVLLEFAAGKDYFGAVEDFVVESLSNGEKVYVFTRRDSQVNVKLKTTDNVSFFLLSPSSSKVAKLGEKETVVPIRMLSDILGIFLTIARSNEHSAIIFDNLTDFMLLTSFEETYKVVRHALDVQASTRTHSLFLVNRDVHSKEILSAFEPLFDIAVKR